MLLLGITVALDPLHDLLAVLPQRTVSLKQKASGSRVVHARRGDIPAPRFEPLTIGYQAGQTGQGLNAIALGAGAGQTGQGLNAIALGSGAGAFGQTGGAISLGYQAGFYNQQSNAIALGTGAGQTGQGANAIAIGAGAGFSGQAANTIILNATGQPLNDLSANTFVVKPVRTQTGAMPNYSSMYYNSGTGEVVSSATAALTGNFCVAGGGATAGGGTLAYSYDGLNWQSNTTSSNALAFSDGSCNAVAWGNNIWVAGGVGESALVYSNDGINWQRNDGTGPGMSSTIRSVLDSGKYRYGVDISYGVVPHPTQKQNFGASLAFNSSGSRMAVGSP